MIAPPLSDLPLPFACFLFILRPCLMANCTVLNINKPLLAIFGRLVGSFLLVLALERLKIRLLLVLQVI